MSEFLFDLKHPETSWHGEPSYSYFAKGEVESKVGSVIDPEPGEHLFYWMLDTIMYKVPEYVDLDQDHFSHYHTKGYETFFVDSGKLYLYINNQKTLVQAGDIVHLQAGQAHGMGFLEDVKWRGTYHDYAMPQEMRLVGNVIKHMPELKDDPELAALNPGRDHIKIEPIVYEEIPAEKCMAVKHPSRPHATYQFDGVTLKVMVERWENGGNKELLLAEMDSGFKVEWVKYPKFRELFYVRKGKVKFKIFNEEFVADDECIVDIPKFAPHCLEALEKSEVYDLGGQTHWSLMLQSYKSIQKYHPERLNDESSMQELKDKFGCYVKQFGL